MALKGQATFLLETCPAGGMCYNQVHGNPLRAVEVY